MELVSILEVLKDYDLVSIAVAVLVYIHINKKLSIVDKAVNNRPIGKNTLSQEVSEIHRKIDVGDVKLSYMVKELDAHRAVDEVEFKSIVEDIKGLHGRVTDLATKNK
jgi:hypothetical protein